MNKPVAGAMVDATARDYGDAEMRPVMDFILKSAATGHEAVAVNRKECSADWYFHRGLIEEHHHGAAVRLRRDWEIAQLGRTGAIDPGRIRVDGGRAADMTARQLDAVQALGKAMRAMGKTGSAIAVSVACLGVTLRQVEAAMAWKRGYALIRLQEALDDLAGHYGLKTGGRRARLGPC
jgi:hypothetical protein